MSAAAPLDGQVLRYDGTAGQWAPAATGSVIQVTAASPLSATAGTSPRISLSGTVAIANGGTGLTTAPTSATQFLRANGAATGGLSAASPRRILPVLSGTYANLASAQTIAGTKNFTGALLVPTAASAPACLQGGLYLNTTDGTLYFCSAGVWKKSAASGGGARLEFALSTSISGRSRPPRDHSPSPCRTRATPIPPGSSCRSRAASRSRTPAAPPSPPAPTAPSPWACLRAAPPARARAASPRSRGRAAPRSRASRARTIRARTAAARTATRP